MFIFKCSNVGFEASRDAMSVNRKRGGRVGLVYSPTDAVEREIIDEIARVYRLEVFLPKAYGVGKSVVAR